MPNARYFKNISIGRGETYYKMDNETGELEEVTYEKISKSGFITPRSTFMKSFSGGKQTMVFSQVGEYYKYVGVLNDCMGNDNALNMRRFRESINITQPAYSKLKKKLVDLGMIAESEGEYYLNPLIGIKSDRIHAGLWDLFKKKNEKMYGIKTI